MTRPDIFEPAIGRLTVAMRRKLGLPRVQAKPDPNLVPLRRLMDALRAEVEELNLALDNWSRSPRDPATLVDIEDEAADVANLAMFVIRQTDWCTARPGGPQLAGHRPEPEPKFPPAPETRVVVVRADLAPALQALADALHGRELSIAVHRFVDLQKLAMAGEAAAHGG